ncbi:hypothetical protein GCM10008171_25240 [Methylopila jiangsuensis]|uniref:Methyltransferase FkbM domain-containing protein n=1 Tax=Methylopila jiangsuensis TaxID=586230 RepID=A0A9W6JJZ7_9HYPH|nr:FkbM family methyltransferase [Methylopila jiangsuensis]MDR6286393.1 FkbM family methyltransferase [Methylopila jiangsuensis]GLK77270.1 hypothetical protein GCM10008171_25240 [Methylopila jiangsuensis]
MNWFARLRERFGARILATGRLNDTVTLHVLSSDNRGLRLKARIAEGRVTDPTARLWRRAQATLTPALSLDVGANYGEISLPAPYAPDQRLILIEANPDLVRALEASVATHASGDRITIVSCFAGEEPGDVDFHVDLKWSGTSSAFFRSPDAGYKGAGRQRHRTLRLPVRTIDDVVGAAGAAGAERVLMKLDVEGAELAALRGAEATIVGAELSLLIVECNARVIARTGGTLEDWLAELGRYGEIFRIRRRNLTPLDADGAAELGSGKHDLAVIRDASPDGARLGRMRALRF